MSVIAVALGASAAAWAQSSPPISAVYGEPGPTPLSDESAKEFVVGAAPSLKHISTEALAQGVIVGSAAKQGPSSSRTSPRPGHRAAVRIAASRAMLERAGVSGSAGIDQRSGFVLAAVLAAAGFAIAGLRNRRPS